MGMSGSELFGIKILQNQFNVEVRWLDFISAHFTQFDLFFLILAVFQVGHEISVQSGMGLTFFLQLLSP